MLGYNQDIWLIGLVAYSVIVHSSMLSMNVGVYKEIRDKGLKNALQELRLFEIFILLPTLPLLLALLLIVLVSGALAYSIVSAVLLIANMLSYRPFSKK